MEGAPVGKNPSAGVCLRSFLFALLDFLYTHYRHDIVFLRERRA
jgi:hypothetical protein